MSAFSLPLHILASQPEAAYLTAVRKDLVPAFERLEDSPLSVKAFSFYTSVSAVFSSKIEGEPIELDSYVRYKRFGAHYLPDYTRKTDDLYDAYQFARGHSLTEAHLHKTHKDITAHILAPGSRSKYRRSNMYVTTPDGRIEYVAAAPDVISHEVTKLWQDVDLLLRTSLSGELLFYYAAMLHLQFVKIHPYEDGNGRTARLLEKWFLAEKLGPKVWFLQSERHYYEQHEAYYRNLRLLGLEYEALDYSKALPFLLMLPDTLSN